MTPLQREDGMGEMTEEQMKKIWEKHNNSKCDCSDGDDSHNEPECYISMGFLKGLEQGRKEIANVIESFLIAWHTGRPEDAAEACDKMLEKAGLDSYRQHRTGKGG